MSYTLENNVLQPGSPFAALAAENLTDKEGHLVYSYGSTGHKLTSAAQQSISGLVLEGAASGSTATYRPWIPGDQYNVWVSAAVALDALLQLDTATPGQLVTATTGPVVARAEAATSGAARVRVRALAGLGLGIVPLPAAYAVNTNATMTAASLVPGGVVTSSTAAAVAATLPTGTLMDTAWGALVPVGHGFLVAFNNTGGTDALTVTAGTDFTLVGSGAVVANTAATFALKRTAANTWAATRMS